MVLGVKLGFDEKLDLYDDYLIHLVESAFA